MNHEKSPGIAMSEKLLPCPFCGSDPILEDHRLVWGITCECGVSVLGSRAPEPDGEMSDSYWADFEQSAIDHWNRRAIITAHVAQQVPISDAEISQIIRDANIMCVHPDARTTIDIARAILAAQGDMVIPISEVIVKAALEAAKNAVKGEKLIDALDDPCDIAYDLALDHALAAIGSIDHRAIIQAARDKK